MGVLGPYRLLSYRQRTLVEWSGLRMVPLGAVKVRQIAETLGHIDMIWTEVSLGHFERLLGDDDNDGMVVLARAVELNDRPVQHVPFHACPLDDRRQHNQ